MSNNLNNDKYKKYFLYLLYIYMSNFITKFIIQKIQNWYKEADKQLNITLDKQTFTAKEIETDIKRLENDYHEGLLDIFIEEGYGIDKENIKNMIEKNKIILEPIKNMVNYYYGTVLGRINDNPIMSNDNDELNRFYIYYIVDILCSDFSTEKYQTHTEDELNFIIEKCPKHITKNDMKIQNLKVEEINEMSKKKQKPNPTYGTYEQTHFTARSVARSEEEQKQINHENLNILLEMSKKFNNNTKKIENLKKLKNRKSDIKQKDKDRLLSEILTSTGKRKRSNGGKKKSRKTKKNKKM